MTYFTDSPYERLMVQIPDTRQRNTHVSPVWPPGHPCRGCPYGRNAPCIGVCYRKLLKGAENNTVSNR